MYHKATTYVSRYLADSADTDPVWHGDLGSRAGTESQRRLLKKLKEEGKLKDGLFIVTTPIPEAETPRAITHIYEVCGDQFKLFKPGHTTRITSWPPKE